MCLHYISEKMLILNYFKLTVLVNQYWIEENKRTNNTVRINTTFLVFTIALPIYFIAHGRTKHSVTLMQLNYG